MANRHKPYLKLKRRNELYISNCFLLLAFGVYNNIVLLQFFKEPSTSDDQRYENFPNIREKKVVPVVRFFFMRFV